MRRSPPHKKESKDPSALLLLIAIYRQLISLSRYDKPSFYDVNIAEQDPSIGWVLQNTEKG